MHLSRWKMLLAQGQSNLLIPNIYPTYTQHMSNILYLNLLYQFITCFITKRHGLRQTDPSHALTHASQILQQKSLERLPYTYCISRTLTTCHFTLEEFQQIFRKIKHRGPTVRNMSRHNLEVVNLLIIATEPVESVIQNV